jgi:hypothetical protein
MPSQAIVVSQKGMSTGKCSQAGVANQEPNQDPTRAAECPNQNKGRTWHATSIYGAKTVSHGRMKPG